MKTQEYRCPNQSKGEQRHDLALQTVTDRFSELASSPTLCRLERVGGIAHGLDEAGNLLNDGGHDYGYDARPHVTGW